MRVRVPFHFSPITIINPTVHLLAKMLGKVGVLGTVAPGAIADFLVLNANPLEDIRVLDRPENHLLAVVKEGRVVTSLLGRLR